jgi:DUF1680 family protein
MYLTGGLGAKHEGEAFGANYELPNLTAYAETCAAIGDVYWNQRLFLLTSDGVYYDVIERTLYNGLISGLSLDGDEFFYGNPLEADGKFKFNQGTLTRQSWFDCSCCPTNLVRFVPSMPNLIYATRKDTAFVNLYASNKAAIKLNATNVELSQETRYPWDGAIKLTVTPQTKANFTLKLRIPGWARNQVLPGDLYSYTDTKKTNFTVRVNGKEVKSDVRRGYVTITRSWAKGDVVDIMLPMSVRRVVSNEKLETNKGLVALENGPIVYCVEEIDNNNDVSTITVPDNATFTVENRPDLLNGVNVVRGKADGKEFTAIPYYAWSNRGIGPMKVWIPRKTN